MKYYRNGDSVLATIGAFDLPEITEAEYAEAMAKAEQGIEDNAESYYWTSVDYSDAVNNEIRKRYSESQEFAILRQQTAKPDEYDAYFAYCEECKLFVKAKKAEYAAAVNE